VFHQNNKSFNYVIDTTGKLTVELPFVFYETMRFKLRLQSFFCFLGSI